jgi:tetratricopeptide (TPR) repeat protein
MVFSMVSNSAIADIDTDLAVLYKIANEHLENGELHEAISIYDKILITSPENTEILLMKGIALSNLDRHKQSMKEFYKVLEKEPNNISAMVGMGVGLGNFGEYKEAANYFASAHTIMPDNHVVKNYNDFAERVIEKYPYNEVEKPKFFEIKLVENVPAWVKNTAGWWANDQIEDSDFLTAMQFLIKNGLVIIESSEMEKMSEEAQKNSDRNYWQFARYLDKIEKTVSDDRRYIEYPNPSNDVIKKFLRDYVKWNYEQQIKIGNKNFPNPLYTSIDGIYHLEYKIYINEQPAGLPLDHVGTLVNSFRYWEGMELTANDGQPAKVHFVTTESKTEANLWVTWVVRDIGENVLGHANLGKGVIEVALGGYGCDGDFQLFEVETIETIMTHELGHGIGLKHTTNPESIMYPTIKETKYAYCLLDISN